MRLRHFGYALPAYTSNQTISWAAAAHVMLRVAKRLVHWCCVGFNTSSSRLRRRAAIIEFDCQLRTHLLCDEAGWCCVRRLHPLLTCLRACAAITRVPPNPQMPSVTFHTAAPSSKDLSPGQPLHPRSQVQCGQNGRAGAITLLSSRCHLRWGGHHLAAHAIHIQGFISA